jgi:hypothetical protein
MLAAIHAASLIYVLFFLILKLSYSSSCCKNIILNLFMFNNGTYILVYPKEVYFASLLPQHA